MNEQNLKPCGYKLTREQAKKGGLKSAETRRRKKDLREALEMLLEKEFTDSKGNVLSGTEVITAKLFEKASKGDVRAFETIRSTVGQDPVQKVMIAEVDQSVIDEVEKEVLEDEP
jgi:hypothetical protein